MSNSQPTRNGRARRKITAAAFAAAVFAGIFPAFPAHAQDAAEIARGKYLTTAGGCANCHTDAKNNGAPFAGGVTLKTPFGTFYGPNITADREHGIGAWSDQDFIRALREGVAPDGRQLFPAFPYTSFTNITDADLRAIKAYLFSLPAVAAPSRAHELKWPFRNRALVEVWKILYFKAGPFVPDPKMTAQQNRGAYLVRALGHCGECHTPRDAFGGFFRDKELAGTRSPNGDVAPNITTDPTTGIGKWSEPEIIDALTLGLSPDGDTLARSMAEVVENVTSKLTKEDVAAVAAYLKAIPPVKHRPR